MAAPGDRNRQRRPRRAVATPLSAAQLERAAAAYIARYDTSSARLRSVLMRRVLKARQAAAPDAPDARVVDAIVARYVKKGVIDDAGYAERKAAGLHRRGASSRQIRERLRLAGIERDGAEQALAATRAGLAGDDADLDLHAAVALARRRRLGPFRPPAERALRRTKDMASLGRAGFPADIARRVIDAEDADALLADETAR